MTQDGPWRPRWESAVLDFLTVRGRVLFDSWTPHQHRLLASLLAHRDWEVILATNLLASPTFLESLRRAARHAARDMERATGTQTRRARGRILGRVLGPETLAERIRTRDRTVWVYEETTKHWETAPNAAIAGFLAYLNRLAPAVESGARGPMSETVRDCAAVVRSLLTSEPLRHVQPDHLWHRQSVPPQLWAKSRFYSLWRHAKAYRRARRTRDTEILRRTLSEGWLRSESDDRLFELFVLSRVVELLHQNGPWSSFEISGVAPGMPFTLNARRPGREVRLVFDRSPESQGAYQWLMERYHNLDGRGRRPDLLLVSVTPAGVKTTFIEVKATEPNSTYGRDSIVKVFGYLKDYSDIWLAEPSATYPRAVLVFTRGISSDVDLAVRSMDEVLLTSSSSIDDDLAAVLSHHV